MDKRFYESVMRVYRVLADNRLKGLMPMNKHQIQEDADIGGRQTILNIIDHLTQRHHVVAEEREWEGKKGRRSMHYTLNDRGLHFVSKHIPELEEKIRKELGPKYDELEKERKDLEWLDDCVSYLQGVVSERRLPPKYQWLFYFRTDSQGRIDGTFGSVIDDEPRVWGVTKEDYRIRIDTRPRPFRFRLRVPPDVTKVTKIEVRTDSTGKLTVTRKKVKIRQKANRQKHTLCQPPMKSL